MRANLLIMGGGIAGLSAAARAAELGKSAIVLEKGRDESYACNSRFTGGALHVCYRDPTSPAATLRSAIEAATVGSARTDLVEALAANAGRVVAWLRDQGVIFVKGGAEEYKRWLFTPMRPQRRGLFWKGLGGDVLLRTLERKIVKGGGMVRRGARAVEAEHAPGGGWTIRTEDGAAFSAPAFLIADGGFQGDFESVRKYISPKPDHLVQRGAGTGAGDGLRIAAALGAAMVGMDRFYGHVLAAEAMQRPDLWPYPWLDPIAAAGVVVGSDARRFVDEGLGGIFIANAIARLAEPLSAWVVFDDNIWRGPGARGMIPPNPNLALADASIAEAPTISGLAAATGLDPAALCATVAEHNAAIAAGDGSRLSPPRSAGPPAAMPIEKPPFAAMRVAAGITYTMGGIAIDANARVLNGEGAPIAGLYAAGTAAGGLEGGPHGGYVGGLATSVLTALLAAEHSAATC